MFANELEKLNLQYKRQIIRCIIQRYVRNCTELNENDKKIKLLEKGDIIEEISN